MQAGFARKDQIGTGVSDDARVRQSKITPTNFLYKAFISYKHVTSTQFASKLELALKGYCKPLLKLPIRIFRDEKHLAPGIDLPELIKEALKASEFLVLLASPDAAISPWVHDELDQWCRALGRAQNLIVILVAGNIAFHEVTKAIDWEHTNALPPILREYLRQIPLYVDFRQLAGLKDLTLVDPDFKRGINGIVARFRNIDPNDMLGEEVLQHRKNLRLRNGAVAALAILTVGSLLATFVAVRQQRIAAESAVEAHRQQLRAEEQGKLAQQQSILAEERQRTAENEKANAVVQRRKAELERNLAVSRELAANATARVHEDPELGVLLALEAARIADTDQAEEALRECLRRSRILATIHAEMGALRSAVFSPDSVIVVAGSMHGSVLAWNIATGKAVLSLSDGLTGEVRVAYAPDGKSIVAGTESGVKLWDSNTGGSTKVLQGPALSVSYSADGTKLLAAGAGRIRVWNTNSWDVQELQAQGREAELSPDKSKVLVFGNWGASVWDLSTKKKLLDLDGLEGEVSHAAFSPDGAHIVTAEADGFVRVWDAINGNSLVKFKGDAVYLEDANFSPDGKTIVTAGFDRTAKVWNPATGNLLMTLRGHGAPVISARFSRDGRMVVTASEDGTIRVWNVSPDFVEQELIGHEGPVNTAAFSSNGERVVTAGQDGTARVWSVATGKLLHILRGSGAAILDARFSRDGEKVVTANKDGMVRVWSISTSSNLAEFPTAPQDGPGAAALSAMFNAIGNKLTSVHANGEIRVWDLKTRRLLAFRQVDPPSSAHVSADGSRVAIAHLGGTPLLTDVQVPNGDMKLLGHTSAVFDVRFSYDGSRAVTASQDFTARIWNTSTSKSLLEILHPLPVLKASLSRDGKMAITVSADGTVRVWNSLTGIKLMELAGKGVATKDVEFSMDGTRLIIATADGIVRIYGCQVCGGVGALVARVRMLATRKLTPKERATYIHSSTQTTRP